VKKQEEERKVTNSDRNMTPTQPDRYHIFKLRVPDVVMHPEFRGDRFRGSLPGVAENPIFSYT